MKVVLLVSHGTMAKGTYEAAKMIIGHGEHIDYLCLSDDIDVNAFKQEMRKKVGEYKGAEQIIVIADLLGGSPYTSALTILHEEGILERSFVVTGMNLMLVIQMALAPQVLSRTEVITMLEESHAAITLYDTDTEDEEELL